QRILEAADDAADALEEATFRLTLLPNDESTLVRVTAGLGALAELALASADAYRDAVAGARRASSTWERAPTQAFLGAVERVVQLERRTDAKERELLADLM